MEDITHKIVDNYANMIEKKNEGDLKEVFEYYIDKTIQEKIKPLRLDIGTGFFYFSGFRSVYKFFKKLYDSGLLEKISEKKWGSIAPIRIVMGSQSNFKTKNILLSIIYDSINQYDEIEIDLLNALISENLMEFRIYLNKRFHAKIYNFYLGEKYPSDIWVGSSNFTLSGLEKNIELTVQVQTNFKKRELFRDWFDSLWLKSTDDINLLEIVNNFKEKDHIYLTPKVYFSKLIHNLNKFYLLDKPSNTTLGTSLFDFQYLSYFIVMERLQKFGGCLLSNSVGLGKSYVAIYVIKAYLKQNPSSHHLIVCPSAVLSNWKRYLHDFGLNNQVDVLSMGRLQLSDDITRVKFFNSNEFHKDYSTIIVDEAHHYRNNNFRRSNLINIIYGNQQSKILLITATPINLGIKDLFNLIDLFYFGNNVRLFENGGLKELYDETKRDIMKADKIDLGIKIIEQIKIIKDTLSIKISWKMVRDYFQDDILKIATTIENYKEPIVNEISYLYSNKIKTVIFDEVINYLQSLNNEPSKLWNQQGYIEDRNLHFWYKWQLYKRLESSIYAFYKSLKNQLNRYILYEAVLSEKSMNVTIQNEFINDYFSSNQERISNVLTSFIGLEVEIQNNIVVNIKHDITQTRTFIENIKNKLMKENNFIQDSKISELSKIIEKNTNDNIPTIIFSQYTDTVDYIYNNLSVKFVKIDFIHGKSGKSKDKIIEKFESGVFDILITTDMLSEGVNLPRGKAIINFDLPYNPVKLIQRAGRALRITNPKQLLISNFTPADEIDLELEIYEKLEVRLNTILDTIGLDFVIWLIDEERIEELKEEERYTYLNKYKNYKDKLANSDPESFLDLSIPQNTILDKNLSRIIEILGIDSEFIENFGGISRKPYYTILRGDNEFFISVDIDGNIHPIGDLDFKSLESNYLPISDSEISKIKQIVMDKSKEIRKERTSKIQLSKNSQKLINDILLLLSKIANASMKRKLGNIVDGLSINHYPPEDISVIQLTINALTNIPNIFGNYEEELKKSKKWEELGVYKLNLKREEKFISFIKYT